MLEQKTNGINHYRRSICDWRRPLDSENGNSAQVHLNVHYWMADDLVGCLSDNRANHYRFDKLKGRIRSAVWIAGVAQLVEQRIRNAKVVGSNPISGTRIVHSRSSL